MKTIDVIILLIIGYVIYLLTNESPKEITPNKVKKVNPSYIDDGYLDELVNEIDEWDKTNDYSTIKKTLPNRNFLDKQFHNDYRDVITALHNLVPSQKQLFNLPNQPVTYSELPPSEVKGMVNDLISSLNNNIKTSVPSERNNNSGWDEAIPDPNKKSGWDKMREGLGLATSLYPKPAPPANVSLVKIDKVQKYETEDEIKYACHLLLQKDNIDDQMILKASLVQDKRSLHDENEFFRTHDLVMRIAVEELFIVGYLSDNGMDANKQFDMVKDRFYDIDRMEHNNLTDPKYIMSELTKRQKLKTREMDYRNSLLDEEGQDFHATLPHPYDYSSYKATRTVYDDMQEPKHFY